MKKLFLFSMLLFLFGGCNHKVKPDVYHVYLEPWELAYIPYKLHDTISFTNQSNGDVLHFKCTKRERYSIVEGDTNECPPTYEFCEVAITEELKVLLSCIENNQYDFLIYTSTSGRRLYIVSKNNQYNFLLNNTSYMCGTCGMNSDTLNTGCFEYRCYSSFDINNFTYTNVGKNILTTKDYSQSPPITDTLGYMYYNQSKGILRFTGNSNEIWSKN